MLEVRRLSYRVTGDDAGAEKEILGDVSFRVPANGFTVITGPNGGGKSTLAKVMMGILPPTSGKVLFDGQDITSLSVTDRAKLGVGFAFQQPVRFKGLTVRALLRLSTGRAIDTETACGYLREVGLCAADYIDREMNDSLSGGELKRIEIAMLIARGSRLSIFDEPEAGIDLWSFQRLIQVFEAIRDKNRGAVVIISHQERILRIADQIVVVAGGRVTGVGAKEEMLPPLLEGAESCRFYTH